jgi:hypothetical protein
VQGVRFIALLYMVLLVLAISELRSSLIAARQPGAEVAPVA